MHKVENRARTLSIRGGLKWARVWLCVLRQHISPRPMQLTEAQVATIRNWAQQNSIMRVRLFGSRSTGCARADSDVDLALSTTFGTYIEIANREEGPLSKQLG